MIYHEEIGEDDPSCVFLGEDELKDESDDGELNKSSDNGVNHLTFKVELLKEGEHDGHEHDGGGQRRLEHSFEEFDPEGRARRVQQRHGRSKELKS